MVDSARQPTSNATKRNDAAAMDLVMRGRIVAMRSRTKGNIAKAMEFYEQALALDPDLFEATVGLAEAHSSLVLSLISDDRGASLSKAHEFVSKALTQRPNSAWAHHVRGEALRAERRMEEAAKEYGTAMALDPSYVAPVANLGFAKLAVGKPDEAIALLERAIQMSPLDPRLDPMLAVWHSRIGLAQMYMGQSIRAVSTLRKALALNPELPWVHFYLGAALALRGEIEEARASLTEAKRLSADLASIGRYKAISQVVDPEAQALRENTLIRGLRLAGLPEA